MPLRALLDETPVVSTEMDDEQWAQAKARVRQDRSSLLMPGCLLPGRLWRSPRGLRYFRHQPDALRACTSHPAESAEHLAAKLVLARAADAAGWSALVEEPGLGWEADVLAVQGRVRVALEVQWSSQTPERYRERQQAYRAAGVHGVWFARHHPATPPGRELPVFPLERRDDGGGRENFYVRVEEREVLLEDAVRLLLTGQVKFAARVATRGRKRSAVVDAYVYGCWKCRAPMTLWRVTPVPVVGECGLHDDHHTPLWRARAQQRGEADVDVHCAAAVLSQERSLPPLARLQPRRTRPVPGGYLAFCCPICGATQGDYELSGWLMERYWDPPEGTVTIERQGPDAYAERAHWCFGSTTGHCPIAG